MKKKNVDDIYTDNNSIDALSKMERLKMPSLNVEEHGSFCSIVGVI